MFGLIFLLSTGRALQLVPLAVGVVAMLIGFAYVSWYRFSYGVTDGVLWVEAGILARSRREVPLTRVQQVDLDRSLIHRALGLTVVRVDTAGGGGPQAEVVLDAIADREADLLRTLLLSRREAAAPTEAASVLPDAPPPPVADELLVHLSTRDLVVAGVTGRHLGAVVVLFGAIYGLAGYLPTTLVNTTATATWAWLIGSAVITLLVAAVVMVIWVLAAAVASVVQDHDYTLVRRGSDLHMRRGLLQQREATLALHRVQTVRVTDNVLRRRLGYVGVQIQSGGGAAGANAPVARLTIPILPRADLGRLLDQVSPGASAEAELVGNPVAARTRWLVRTTVPILIIVAAVTLGTANPVVTVGLVALVPAAWWATAYYRSLGHTVTETHVVSRWGALFRTHAFTPIAKVQGCRLVSSPFQRRVGLATLRVAVAGDRNGVPIPDGSADRLRQVGAWLPTSREMRQDEVAVRRRLVAARRAS